MANRNHKPSLTPEEIRARKVKLAEGGIVFALVVGLCVFLGIHFADDGGERTVAARVVTQDAPPAPVTVSVEPTTTPVSTEAAAGETEPAAVVSADHSPAADVGAEKATESAGDAPLTLQEMLPDVPVAVTYSTAEQTYFAGRYDEAAAMFAVYSERHPENTWGHYMRGLALWKADRDVEAAEALEQALALKADHLKSLVNLARVQLELDRPDDALASIESALDVAPDNVDARRVLGRVYHELGRLEDAAAAYGEALRLRSDDAWSLNNLALVRIEQDDHAAALPALARAVELAPEVAVIRNNLGTALECTGHLAQAREQYLLAADLGSARGELSLARLDAVEIPAADAVADLGALAAAWSLPGDDNGDGIGDAVAAPTADTVAAVTTSDDDEIE